MNLSAQFMKPGLHEVLRGSPRSADCALCSISARQKLARFHPVPELWQLLGKKVQPAAKF